MFRSPDICLCRLVFTDVSEGPNASIYKVKQNIFFFWRCGPTRAMATSFLRFLDYTQLRATVGRTPLDE